jgi:hypothetical protein
MSKRKKVPVSQWIWISATRPLAKFNFPGVAASIKANSDVEVVEIVMVAVIILAPYIVSTITAQLPVPDRKISSRDIWLAVIA